MKLLYYWTDLYLSPTTTSGTILSIGPGTILSIGPGLVYPNYLFSVKPLTPPRPLKLIPYLTNPPTLPLPSYRGFISFTYASLFSLVNSIL